MPTASTLGGWAVVIVAGVTYYWATNQRKNKNKRPIPKVGREAESNKEERRKRSRKDGNNSGGDSEVKSQKEKKKVKPAAAEDRTYQNAVKDTDGEDDSINNREFARQMSNAKTGTLAVAKSQATSKPKSVKQAHAKEKAFAETSSDNATAPSSTTGGDADDDQSPINSPDLNATTVASPVTNGVSDMLEKPAPGPSVLRVTSPTNPSQPKKEKMAPPSESAETKKQRQNKKKAEAAKKQREEEEQQRKVLMEKQRRIAREAEGRAAKDGSAFMAAKAPSSSAWTGKAAPVNGKKATSVNNFELLDTNESSSTATNAVDPSTAKPATKPVPNDELYSPSEIFGTREAELAKMSYEEQVEYATEASTRWEVVKAKDRKKKAAQKGKEPAEQSHSSTDDTPDFAPPKVIAPTGPGQKWESTTVWVDKDGTVHEETDEIKDSEWEVS
ncbi:hypothetical protein N431DRAFT_436075 [Stipitochalara longipes BDJ]|nr:hypothetical protein N431DRAFT_436075 [Stipitochalara longipes BDJ]